MRFLCYVNFLNIMTWRQKWWAILQPTILKVEVFGLKHYGYRKLILLTFVLGTFKYGIINHFLLLIDVFEDLKKIVDDLYGDILVILIRVDELWQELD